MGIRTYFIIFQISVDDLLLGSSRIRSGCEPCVSPEIPPDHPHPLEANSFTQQAKKNRESNLMAEVGGWALLWKSPFFFQWCGKTGRFERKMNMVEMHLFVWLAFFFATFFTMVSLVTWFVIIILIWGFFLQFLVSRNTGLRRKSTWRIISETILLLLPVPQRRVPSPHSPPTRPNLEVKVIRVVAKAQATLMPKKTQNLRQNLQNRAHLLKSLKPTRHWRVCLWSNLNLCDIADIHAISTTSCSQSSTKSAEVLFFFQRFPFYVRFRCPMAFRCLAAFWGQRECGRQQQ